MTQPRTAKPKPLESAISGFTLTASLNGASVTVQPVASGQYHNHADVAATRIGLLSPVESGNRLPS
jgi:hypothetical protein